VKAAADDQALLLELQALDTRIAQLDHRAKSLPQHEALKAIAVDFEAARVAEIERSGAREDVAIELKRVESDVAVVETRIARDSERLQASSSVKDVQAFEQELVALRRRQNDLEEIELTVMERLEEVDAALASTRAESASLAAQVAEVSVERDAALAEINAERSHAAANRQTIASTVPADLLGLYEKQRSRYGNGASLLRGGVSSASGVKLLENDLQVIRAAAPDDVLLCPDSNAILVRTSESGL
jgi:uncharacterized protein